MPKTYPIDRLSFSAVREYLSNPWRFHRIYVLKIQTFTDSPATLVGRAFHKCLELFYSSPDFRTEEGLARAKESALSIIRAAAPQVDWGKTGSLEKSEAEALQTIDHYFAENPNYEAGNELETEKIFQGRIKGIPVTLKAVSDLKVKGLTIGVVDFKKVSQLTVLPIEKKSPLDGIPPTYLIQAWFNEKSIFANTGERLDWMKFHEVKTSKNKDGGSQHSVIHLDFKSQEWKAMDKIIKKMVQNILRDVSRKHRVWLPNIADQMAGEESWQEFLSG